MKQAMRILLCGVLAAGLLLSSCGKKPETPDVPLTGSKTEPVTTVREPGTDDPIDYETLSRVPFEGLEPSPEGDFTAAETSGGLTVTGYTGTDKKVRIPDSIGGKPVTGIADEAFRGNTGMTVLWIPDGVTSFGRNILVGTKSLYALHTPLPTEEGKRFLGWLFGAESYERNNVEDLRRIDFLEIGGHATELPAYSLFDCNDLVTLRLPEGMTQIGDWALARCAALRLLDVSGLRSLGSGALMGCTSLRELTFSATLETIGREALGNCNGLRRLTLPFAGGSRTENRFLGWLFGAKIAELSPGLYPAGLREIVLLNDAGSLADEAFYAAPIVTLTIGTGLTEIGARAFADCANLKSVSLTAGITAIRDNAFTGCTALKTVILPEGMTEMGINTFLGCTALTAVTLPGSLTDLPAGSFMGCTNLREVTLGGVTKVGSNAFRGCASLAAVRAAGSVSFAGGNDAAKAVLTVAP